MLNAPVAIGGTGGSGTRLVAQILSAARRFLGRRLNAFYDAPDLAEFDPQWGLPHLLDEAGPEMSTAFGAGRTPGPSRRCLARIATWWCDWRTYAASPKPRFGACSTSPATHRCDPPRLVAPPPDLAWGTALSVDAESQ